MSIVNTNGAIASAQRMLEAIKAEQGIAQLITDNDPRTHHLSSFDRQNIVRTQGVFDIWKKIGRQVLAMHPAIVDEVKVASSDKIPGEILRVLPYMNPLVVFSEPPEFKTWVKSGQHKMTKGQEDRTRLLGFFTYGTRTYGYDAEGNTSGVEDRESGGIYPSTGTTSVRQKIYSTTDPEANRFGMLLVLEVLDAQGRQIDIELNNMTIYFDQTATLSETVDSMMGRYHWSEDDPKAEAHHRKWMRQIMSTCLGSLFYLCSTTLEAEKVPAKATKALGKNITRKPLSLYRVGWTTGAALTRFRQGSSRSLEPSVIGDLTHQRDPEHRRSHFKMQPYGPARSLRRLIFVSAYWTHKERLGEEGINTARSVPRVGRRGDARESQRETMRIKMPAEVE